MDWQIAFTLVVVLLALTAMVRQVAAPDMVLMAALLSLALAGILTPAETFSGFANPAVATIGALFMVSAALRQTGALDLSIGRFLNGARGTTAGALRVTAPVASLSAFLNNAPIVAMMTPSVIEWARRNNLSPSRFLIPLSYAAILGSCTTIIGTSVNLTVAGLIVGAGMEPMSFFGAQGRHAGARLLRAGAGGGADLRARGALSGVRRAAEAPGPRRPDGGPGQAPARIRGRHGGPG